MSERPTGPRCRYDAETDGYLIGGQPCERDEYGDRTHHCQSARCSNHVGYGEITCARCVHRVRMTLRRLADLSALLLPAAIAGGVNSEAANLAGPAADPEAWAWRKVAAKQGKAWHLSLIEDDDEQHPYSVLGRWEMMIREDYGQPSDEPVSIAGAADYLGRQLHRIAQDPEQEFALLAKDLRKCRDHIERVMSTASYSERGAPCPECTDEASGVGPRLKRRHGHWCEDPECRKEHHYLDDSGDEWVCPRDKAHAWDHEEYTRWVEERKKAKTA